MNQENDGARYARPVRPHPVWWVIAVSLAVIAVSSVLRFDGELNRPAFAQASRSAGAHGTFAFTGQIAKNAYGVFMVDVDAGTLWCYRFDQGSNVLKLVAGRDWRFDRYLANYSTDPPTTVIEQMLEDQRNAKRK